MKKFLKDLEKELKELNVNQKEIEEILADHKEMIEAAKQEGLNEDQIIYKFGDPSKVAAEIHNDLSNFKFEINSDDIESFVEYNINDYVLAKTFTGIHEGLDIKVSLVSDDVLISDYDGESIQVFYKDIKKIEDYDITLTNNCFTINKKKKVMQIRTFILNKNSGNFLVLIPNNLKHKSCNYHTVSGDVAINGLFVNSFTLKSTNGDLKFSNINLGITKLNLVNGDIEITGFKAKSTDISLVNGNIELGKGEIEKEIYINSVSGDSSFKDIQCDKASFKTVSGDLDGRNFYVNELSLKTVSGDVNIENEDKSREINIVNKKTVSGDVNIN